MAVLLETSRGDLVLDLYVDEAPLASRNFLKLCKIKYYNNCLFHNVQKDFIVQTGDPTGTGRGGMSLNGVLYGEQARFFDDEIIPHIRHTKKGIVGMAGAGENLNASQFYITTGAELDSLDGKHTVFGEVSEGLDVLMAINEAFVDDEGRPLQNVRIRHTVILDDPFPDPPQLQEHIPEQSPELVREEGGRLEDDWKPGEGDQRSAEEIEEETRKTEAANRAVVLEMIGDLPEADAKPPSNMLFICKLNPVTTEEDLEIIFSRFGTVTSCDIIRDWKTGDSLCYAFMGFDNDESCEEAYFKMNNVLIDDRRIKVDFSQSVYHLWKNFRRFGRAGGREEAAAAAGLEGGKEGGQKRERFELKDMGMRHPGGDRYQLLLDGDDDMRAGAGPSSSRARDREAPSMSKRRDGGPFAQDRRDQGRGRGPPGDHRDRGDHARGAGDRGLSLRDRALEEFQRGAGRKRSRSRDGDPYGDRRPGPPEHGRSRDGGRDHERQREHRDRADCRGERERERARPREQGREEAPISGKAVRDGTDRDRHRHENGHAREHISEVVADGSERRDKHQHKEKRHKEDHAGSQIVGLKDKEHEHKRKDKDKEKKHKDKEKKHKHKDKDKDR
eukprot:jgi/Botrbrau1/14889/Bobra.0248s0008.1